MAVKKFREGIGLDPQSSDPASPFEGQFQYSDGTHRSIGLWEYRGASWIQVTGTGSSSRAVTEVTTTPYTILITDEIVEINSGPIYNVNHNISLPTAASSEGLTFTIYKKDYDNRDDYSVSFDASTNIDDTDDYFDLDGADFPGLDDTFPLATGDAVQLTTTDTLPAPLVISTTYYIAIDPIDSDLIHLSTTYANAVAGTYIDLTTTGVDFTTITREFPQTRIINSVDSAPIRYKGEEVSEINVQQKNDVISLYSNGTEWLSLGEMENINAEIYFETGNGHGSTSTKVRKYTNLRKHTGKGLTYSNAAASGTIVSTVSAGVYTICWADATSGSAEYTACVVGSPTGTTSAESLSYADGRRGGGVVAAAGPTTSFSWTGRLDAGTQIAIRDNGSLDSTSDYVYFSVTKVGK